MRLRLFFLIYIIMCMPVAVCAQQDRRALENRLREIIHDKRAETGIAVIIDGRDTLTMNNDGRYPLMSAMKFHQSLAVCRWLERKELPLSHRIHIRPADLKTGTYSPLRDKYPEGDIDMTVGDLLTYSLGMSDNNACDILFRRTMGVKATDKWLRSLGLTRFAIKHNEEDMHRNTALCHENWSSPKEAARLLDMFISQDIVGKEYADFVRRTMIACRTGKDRLVKPLEGTGAVVGHKTGTSDRDDRGRLTAVNDIAFVLLPGGHRYTIAVMVKDSKESLAVTEKIIADISEAVYQFIILNS